MMMELPGGMTVGPYHTKKVAAVKTIAAATRTTLF